MTQTYRLAERGKIQALHDFVMFAAVSIGTFSSGKMLEAWGWKDVNRAVRPFLFIVSIPLGILAIKRHRLLWRKSLGRQYGGVENLMDSAENGFEI